MTPSRPPPFDGERGMSRRVIPLLLGVWLLAPTLARGGDPAVDAAVQADDVNQQHCASLDTRQVDRAASATVAVAEAWGRVDEVYEQTGADYLLYWRGVLAQCLGRDEAALADLTAFVQGQEGSTQFSSMVKLARTRVRRLGDPSRLGQGAAGALLTRGGPLEVGASWSAGSGVHELACTDGDDWGTVNSTCVGTDEHFADYRPAAVPASVQAHIDGFPTRAFGLGARVLLALPAPGGLPDSRSPGPTLQLDVGPQLRLLESVSSGRRPGWLRVEVRFAASFARMSPMAGSAKYVGETGGYLDAGTWSLAHPGVSGRLEGALELGPKAALILSGRVAWYAPMPGQTARRVVEPGEVELGTSGGSTRLEGVQVLPELVRSSQLSAGGRVGLALPIQQGSAVTPFVAVDFLRATMTFPDSPGDCWVVGSDEACDSDDGLHRKVFSTRRHDLYVTAGVDVRFAVRSGPEPR